MPKYERANQSISPMESSRSMYTKPKGYENICIKVRPQ